jgi:hypothetical protein
MLAGHASLAFPEFERLAAPIAGEFCLHERRSDKE